MCRCIGRQGITSQSWHDEAKESQGKNDEDDKGKNKKSRKHGGSMAAVSGILNHQMTAVNPLTNAKPMSSSSTGGGNSGEASNISANDFLTLLVTEMKNQDPTANTDPNQYINQLVQVNSL